MATSFVSFPGVDDLRFGYIISINTSSCMLLCQTWNTSVCIPSLAAFHHTLLNSIPSSCSHLVLVLLPLSLNDSRELYSLEINALWCGFKESRSARTCFVEHDRKLKNGAGKEENLWKLEMCQKILPPEITEIPIRTGLVLSVDPCVSWNTVGNLPWNFYLKNYDLMD